MLRSPYNRTRVTPAPNTEEPTASPLSRQLRILVVDDDRDSVLTLTMLLQDEGHDVRAAYSGGSALMVAHHFRPDAVFVDISLPDISGWEVARQLASDSSTTPRVLIAVSGVYKKSADKMLARSVGFSHYVTKPYDPPALLALLDPLIWGED
ncbi:MAG TPA: response regulator [Candidatus Binataceae bacterium]|nr:response regulator [Candidatus Binataceae bacterium]